MLLAGDLLADATVVAVRGYGQASSKFPALLTVYAVACQNLVTD